MLSRDRISYRTRWRGCTAHGGDRPAAADGGIGVPVVAEVTVRLQKRSLPVR
jgi:hypothetical protein